MVRAFGTVLGTAGTADPSQVHPTGLVGTMIIVLAFSIYSIVLLVFSAPAERRDEPLRA